MPARALSIEDKNQPSEEPAPLDSDVIKIRDPRLHIMKTRHPTSLPPSLPALVAEASRSPSGARDLRHGGAKKP